MSEIVSTQLQDISTLDLIDELMKRCEPAIFIGHKTEDGNEPSTFWEYMGEPSFCYGLCQQMAFKIQSNEVAQRMKDILDNDSDN